MWPWFVCVLSRKLWEVFSRHVGSKDVLSRPQIRKALNEIDLYPTKSQGKSQFNLIHCSGVRMAALQLMVKCYKCKVIKIISALQQRQDGSITADGDVLVGSG